MKIAPRLFEIRAAALDRAIGPQSQMLLRANFAASQNAPKFEGTVRRPGKVRAN
jgi:hypothetical protein